MLAAALLMLAVPQNASASPAQDADGTQRWSILVDPCAKPSNRQDEILVCARAAETTQRLPLPGERAPPDRPMPSNPDASGAGALAAVNSPCATLSGGCTTGVDLFGSGTFLVRAIGKLIDPGSCCEEPGEATSPALLVRDVWAAIKKGTRKKEDKSKRVPILLDDLPAEAEAKNSVPAP